MEVGQRVIAGDGRGEIVEVAAGAALVRDACTSRTRWHFLSDVAPVERSCAIAPDSLPQPLRVFGIAPSPTSNENMLIFLHGLGDTHDALFALGSTMALPQTAVMSVRAPLALPFDLGYAWYHALDNDGNVLLPRAASAARSQSLAEVVTHWHQLLHVLHVDYGWPYARMFLFGFAQGATTALHVAASTTQRLGGVVSVSGAFLSAPNGQRATPALLLQARDDSLVPTADAAQTATWAAQALGKVSARTFDGPGPLALNARERMAPVMEFLADTLHLRNLALEQQADLIEIK
ncbi:hypothetical protein ACHHYP_04855 [Achlya hypogyna]|uniref:Phospholipase/carboxylesterase/thioesterase domain-containing protein n=1 Tax=Achlya hypogyna TaxID=1202772 RepID=A0A1V9YZL5_ACHHY|nr:hypothetical protein ACHHYP_04855 [Achlya hypogyna]